MEIVPELPRRASGEDPDDQLRVPLGSGRHRSSGRHPFDPRKTASTHRRTYGTSSYRVSALPPRRVSVPMIADLGCIRDPRWKKLITQEDKELKINWKRVAITSMFGFAYVGPVGHYWYEYLDRYIRVRLQLQPKSLKFVTAKVAADELLCGPLDLLIFFSYMGFASGRSADQVKEDVKRDFLPALVVGAGVWPFLQVANFRFVPVRYQLLYVNLFCLLDSSFLSWIEQQGDAAWKQWFIPIVTQENQKGQA